MAYEKKELPDLADEDYMPSGKYSKNGTEGETKMINVPAKHLLYIYENSMCNQRVAKYIASNLDVILDQIKKESK